MAYSIITGASKGIGKALATECAKMQRNLILVSLPGEDLAQVAQDLSSRYKIKTEYYETDLTANGSVEEFYDWCLNKNFSIDMLVNNAGLGSQGKFEFSSPGEFQKMMQLNMDTVVSMSWGALCFLKKHEQSYILNVGSIGSFTPVPYKTVYSSTKHFVLAFSDALYYELKNTPIFVGCLCPGPTITNQEHQEKIDELGWKARLLVKNANEVARHAIEGILNGDRVIVPGIGNKVIAILGRLLPISWRLKLAGATFEESSFTLSNSSS